MGLASQRWPRNSQQPPNGMALLGVTLKGSVLGTEDQNQEDQVVITGDFLSNSWNLMMIEIEHKITLERMWISEGTA